MIALARFQSSDDEAGIRVTKALIELLQHDPSAYSPHSPTYLISVRFGEQCCSTWNRLVLPFYSLSSVREMLTPSIDDVFTLVV